MTLDSTTSRVQYTQAGTTTEWPVTFKFLDAEDLIVVTTVGEVDTTLELDTDYTVDGAGDDSGGTVTIDPAVPAGTKVTIYRVVDLDQPTELTTAGGWYPKVHEGVFDRLTMQIQQVQEQADRSLRLSVTSTLDPEDAVTDVFEARDEAQAAAADAENSAERAEIASSTVAYYNHEGTLAIGESDITLPWAYDTSVGVEVYLSGVKQAESSLVFTDAYTVTLSEAVAEDTPFEAVASAGASGEFAEVLAASGGSALVGFLQAGTGATARTVQAKLRDSVSVKDFGAVGDGVADDTAAIQAAIDSGALNVYVPDGVYITTAPLIINKNSVKLHGDGSRFNFKKTAFDTGSIIKYSGDAGGTVIGCSPVLASAEVLYGVCIENILIDGNGLAGRGLFMRAIMSSSFRQLSIRNCSIAAIDTGGFKAEDGWLGLDRVHTCDFHNIYISQNNETDGYGFLMGSGDNTWSTTTVCILSNIHILHNNQTGFFLRCGDSNLFQGMYIGRVAYPSEGTGTGIVLGAQSVFGKAVNSNTFVQLLCGNGGLVNRAGAYSANGNTIFGLLIDTDNPMPIIEEGSKLFYIINKSPDFNDNSQGVSELNVIGDIKFPPTSDKPIAIDFKNGENYAALRFKNNQPIVARNAAGDGDIELYRTSTDDKFQVMEDLRLKDGKDLLTGGTTGSKIGAATVNKLGFWGATPIVQPSTTGTTTGHTAGAGAAVLADSTFTGALGTKAYTIGDIVNALKLAGLIAKN